MKTQEIDFSFLNTKADTFELPSRGLPYAKNSPLSSGKVHIKPWTTAVEKTIDKLNSGNFYSICTKLVEAAVTDYIDVTELTDQDLTFILYWARTLTYGPVYSLNTTCPSCGNDIKVKINIAEMDLTFLEKYDETFDVEVPVSQKKNAPVIKMKMRLPRVADLIKTSEYKPSDLTKIGIKVNPEIHRYALCTTEMELPNDNHDVLNEETLENFTNATLKKIWSELPASSLVCVRKAIEKYKHGYITPVKIHCPECEAVFDQAPLLDWGFFRPGSDDTNLSQELPNDIQ